MGYYLEVHFELPGRRDRVDGTSDIHNDIAIHTSNFSECVEIPVHPSHH